MVGYDSGLATSPPSWTWGGATYGVGAFVNDSFSEVVVSNGRLDVDSTRTAITTAVDHVCVESLRKCYVFYVTPVLYFKLWFDSVQLQDAIVVEQPPYPRTDFWLEGDGDVRLGPCSDSGYRNASTTMTMNVTAASRLRQALVRVAKVEATIVVDKILLDEPIDVSDRTLLLECQDGLSCVLDGQDRSQLFVVLRGQLFLRRLTLQHGRGALYGGSIYASHGSTVTAVACLFLSNHIDGTTSPEGGGAVEVNQFSSFNATDCTFRNNTALNSKGGAVRLSDSAFAAKRCVFVENKASGTRLSRIGGAVFANRSTLRVDGSVFVDNSATDNGGAVAVQGPGETALFLDSRFEANDAVKSGGALWLYFEAVATVVNCTFVRNFARNVGELAEGGGAVAVAQRSRVSLESSNFSGNEVHGNNTGAALFCEDTSTIYASKTTLASRDQGVSMQGTCSLFWYLTNSNGSRAFYDEFLRPAIVDQSSPAALLDIRHWTYPCAAGKTSSDGVEHGNSRELHVDANLRTIDENDEENTGACVASSVVSGVRCPDSCAPCDGGTYLPFTLDRYRILAGCTDCPVGTFLPDDTSGSGSPMLRDEIDDCSPCSAGSFSNTTGAKTCTPCPSGVYAPEVGAVFCITAEPGRVVSRPGANASLPCPPGSVSVGGASACRLCEAGTFVDTSGESSCIPADSGLFVPMEGATSPLPCPVGKVSGAGATECSDCAKGDYNDRPASQSCIRCPSPLTTSGSGATYCDACEKGFYFDSPVFSKFNASDQAGQPCLDCCVPCSDACHGFDGDRCVDCSKGNVDLVRLPVKEGFWRATKYSPVIYKCELEEACRGGEDTASTAQCSRSTHGALCGTCRQGYYYDIDRNRCRDCNDNWAFTTGSAMVAFFVFAVAAFIFSLYVRSSPELQTQTLECRRAASDGFAALVFDRLDPRHAQRVLTRGLSRHSAMFGRRSSPPEEEESEVEKGDEEENDEEECDEEESDEEESDEEESDEEESDESRAESELSTPRCQQQADESDPVYTKRSRRMRSFFAKLKILVTTYQIASAMSWVLPSVRFVAAVDRTLKVVRYFGLSVFRVGNANCVAEFHYFRSLVVLTMLPIAVVLVVLALYAAVHKCKASRKLSNVWWYTLLLIYFALPYSSNYTFRYFQCLDFERGDNLEDAKMLAADLTISCRSRTYKRWLPYVILMILVWPVGVTLASSIILYAYRHRLNPRLSDEDQHDAARADGDEAAPEAAAANRDSEMWTCADLNLFEVDRRRYANIEEQARKLKIREYNDNDIKHIHFLYDEYKPCCYFFFVFEILRRLFLTGIVAMFKPGSMSQIVVAILGAGISERCYAYYSPFIDDTDNMVSSFAQTELVLLFFAALVIYVSRETDEKQGVFRSKSFTALLLFLMALTLLVAIYAMVSDVYGREKFDRIDEKLFVVARSVSRSFSERWRPIEDPKHDCVLHNDESASTSDGTDEASDGSASSEDEDEHSATSCSDEDEDQDS